MTSKDHAIDFSGAGPNPDSAVRKGSAPAVRKVFTGLFQRVEEQAATRGGQKPEISTIHSAMTEPQIARYIHAIMKVLLSRNAKVVTPKILFEAADIAVAGEVSMSEARVGLQPGTMNPIHYGHISASLAGILVNDLDMVLLANGGTVPDKPNSVGFGMRNEMLRIAIREQGLSEWLQITPIRQQAVEMFAKDQPTLCLAGENETARRSNMDMAAFIWLFRANPKVAWTYLVGSDKVAGYGRLGESDLIIETLADTRVNAQVLYFVRDGEDLNVADHIAPYDWLLERWQAGFFRKSPLPTCAVSASRIKADLVNGCDRLALRDCLSEEVLTYILTHKTLLASYAREIQELEHNRNAGPVNPENMAETKREQG